jgi:nuclear transcription Y subunit beta
VSLCVNKANLHFKRVEGEDRFVFRASGYIAHCKQECIHTILVLLVKMSHTSNFTGFSQLEHPQPQRNSRASSSTTHDANVRHDNNLLPIANVGRIMKDALPPQAKISKHAKETIQECTTEFVGFVTGEASERCRRERRKTINGDDICHAMRSLGLDHYADAMRRYLQRYRETEELAAALNSGGGGHDGSAIQIDVRDELSIFKGSNQQGGRD